MRHKISLHFDALEGRKLLTHVGTAHPAADLGAPLVLTGLLTVNEKDTTSVTNDDGSQTTSAPVSGRLGTLGKVTGTWDESSDDYGDSMGPDTLQLQASKTKGSIVVEFNNQNKGKVQPVGHGLGFYQHAQKLEASSGGFAKDTENGSIEVFVNSSKKTVESLQLLSVNT